MSDIKPYIGRIVKDKNIASGTVRLFSGGRSKSAITVTVGKVVLGTDFVILSAVNHPGDVWYASLADGTNLPFTARLPHFVRHSRSEGSRGLDSRDDEPYK